MLKEQDARWKSTDSMNIEMQCPAEVTQRYASQMQTVVSKLGSVSAFWGLRFHGKKDLYHEVRISLMNRRGGPRGRLFEKSKTGIRQSLSVIGQIHLWGLPWRSSS